MELLLKRNFLKKEYTIGSLFINDKYFCDVLEDTVRDINKNGKFDCGEYKVKDLTAIPYGEYEVQLTYSPKFKRELPILINVPNFEGIRIHKGNVPEHSSGCLLVGENKERGKVINSTKYETELVKIIKSAINKAEKITIKIV